MIQLSNFHSLKASHRIGKRPQIVGNQGLSSASIAINPLRHYKKGFCRSSCSPALVEDGTVTAREKLTGSQHKAAPSKLVSELGWKTNFHSTFKITRRLGAGEFGTVYAAEHIGQTSDRFAVKVLSKARRGFSRQETLQKLRNEVESWMACQGNENVAQLIETYEDAECVYLIQELCGGGDLSNWVKDAVLSEYCCARVMRAVLSVLRECHARYIAFGDVKPANFLLTQQCSGGEADLHTRIKAADFGGSLRLKDVVSGRRKRQGTPVYMAPEAWSSTYGVGVDIWSAGVMMYQLLSGRFPFWSCRREQLDPAMPAWQVMMAVCTSPITFVAPEWRLVSPEAKSLLLTMLDRDPGTRISAQKALEHPWFRKMLMSTAAAAAATAAATATNSTATKTSKAGGNTSVNGASAASDNSNPSVGRSQMDDGDATVNKGQGSREGGRRPRAPGQGQKQRQSQPPPPPQVPLPRPAMGRTFFQAVGQEGAEAVGVEVDCRSSWEECLPEGAWRVEDSGERSSSVEGDSMDVEVVGGGSGRRTGPGRGW